jgi:hypothetical protein
MDARAQLMLGVREMRIGKLLRRKSSAHQQSLNMRSG